MPIPLGSYFPLRQPDGTCAARVPTSILEARNLEATRQAAESATQMETMGRSIEAEIRQMDNTPADFCSLKGRVVGLGVKLSAFAEPVDFAANFTSESSNQPRPTIEVKPANGDQCLFSFQHVPGRQLHPEWQKEYIFSPQGGGFTGTMNSGQSYILLSREDNGEEVEFHVWAQTGLAGPEANRPG